MDRSQSIFARTAMPIIWLSVGAMAVAEDDSEIISMTQKMIDDPVLQECLDFANAADKADYQQRYAEIRTAIEGMANNDSPIVEGLTQMKRYELLIAEYSNPGCTSGVAAHAAPPWPKG